MTSIKDYIGKHFINKRLHLKCDCIIGIDVTGICTEYKVVNNEVVLILNNDEKRKIPIALNTPKLNIEIL